MPLLIGLHGFPQDGPHVIEAKSQPRFHFVIVDYLCERIGGEPRAGSDVTDVAFAGEDELDQYHLTETATRVLKRAFAMELARRFLQNPACRCLSAICRCSHNRARPPGSTLTRASTQAR